MKKLFLLTSLLAAIAFTACEDDDPIIQKTALTIRYEFNASELGEYDFQAKADTIVYFERTETTSWSKVLNVPAERNGPDSAILTVFPPVAWVGTGIESNVTLRIFINDVLKATKTGLLLGVDRPNGIRVAYGY